MSYNFRKIEKKWQEKWEKDKTYQPSLDEVKKPFYNLMMFPYPSAEGLHIGNMYAYTNSDTYGRFKRLQGYDVFEPIGLDGFGIHSENYAMKIGEDIKDVSRRTEKNFYHQLHMIGNAYDWSRTVETYKPEYYKWTQWLFLKMYEKGLAYRKKAVVNWCSSCKTVLANEQVIQDHCERCETEVKKKQMEQWFWKITDYAERLLKNLESLPDRKAGIDWSEDVKLIQKNWIGKSEGALIKFKIKDSDKFLEIFTTRPDTLDGCTFMVVSPEHELAGKNATAINPYNKKEIPVFTDEYVLSDYGTGAIMAVPAHDERDMAFAKKHNLPISNAELIDGNKVGKKTINYKLRDWCISRQRYWGPPIPMTKCAKCKWQPVSEKDLPIGLDADIDTKCPKCGGPAKRETDVSDVFVDSSWYFMRYLDPHNKKEPFDKLRARKWLPVDMYIGGKEHSVLHLLYSRFVNMVMHELGYVPEEEPYKKFRAHGLLIKDGAKISKSKNNIVNPDEYIEKFGADTVRMYLMFLGEMRQGGDWRDEGIIGIKRFLEKVWKLEIKDSDNEKLIHKTIKKVTEDLENLKFNTAISALMTLVNKIEGLDKRLVVMLAPFAPHIAEELWSKLGGKNSVHEQKWPEYDPKKIEEEEFELIVQINGKFKGNILAPQDITQEKAEALADKFLAGKPKRIIFVKNRLINFVL